MTFMHAGRVSSVTVWKDSSFYTLYADDPNTSLFAVEKTVMLEMVYKG
jgi:hypothetical protein